MGVIALDTSENSRRYIKCLADNGISAIGRYYTRRRTNPKILTAEEARLLSAAGIRIWAVYQNMHRTPDDFSAAKGLSEARDALDYATNVIHQPVGSGIYFSADFDVENRDLRAAIRPHFEAIAAAFAEAGSPYKIGVYSSGAVCRDLLDRGLVQLTWLSQSAAFRGTPEFKASHRWNILQAMPVRKFCGFDDDIDPDTLNPDLGDFGGFLLPEAETESPQRAPLPPAPPALTLHLAAVSASPFPDTPPFRGTPLVRGETASADVKALQARLNTLGFGPLVVDGDFGEATENAVLYFQARNAAPGGAPLEIDGEVGATTWAALFGPGSVFSTQAYDPAAPLRDLVIDIAASQIGVTEHPRGSNRGPEVDRYIHSTGLDPADDSYPWCVCFLYWVFEQASRIKGIPNPLPRTAGVISLWRASRRTEADVVPNSEASADTVKPGMIFHLDTGNGKGHAGLVIEVAGDRLITIEGNTNPGGSSDGFGVFRRHSRPISSRALLGYVDFCTP